MPSRWLASHESRGVVPLVSGTSAPDGILQVICGGGSMSGEQWKQQVKGVRHRGAISVEPNKAWVPSVDNMRTQQAPAPHTYSRPQELSRSSAGAAPPQELQLQGLQRQLHNAHGAAPKIGSPPLGLSPAPVFCHEDQQLKHVHRHVPLTQQLQQVGQGAGAQQTQPTSACGGDAGMAQHGTARHHT
mgnify:CR=1 FL=1